MYMPNFKSPGHQEVCFYTVKYRKKVIFCTFLGMDPGRFQIQAGAPPSEKALFEGGIHPGFDFP